jgi:hypothetical protein
MVNVPELLFVFYVYCTARQSSHGYSRKNEPHHKFNANACLQVKCNSKRVSYVAIDQMHAIIDEYGPEFSSGDRDLPPTASANSIRWRFHCWNPGFHFAFFYCSFQNRWVPYLGVMGKNGDSGGCGNGGKRRFESPTNCHRPTQTKLTQHLCQDALKMYVNI